MPVYNSQFFEDDPGGDHRISPTVLANFGPILTVSVSIPQALADLYARQQIPLPSPITGIALIDTGATRSCVHGPIMTALGVNPIGVVNSGTVAGQALHNLFPAHFMFPAARIDIDFAAVVGVDLAGQIINNQQLIALIGRDVLSSGIFVYNGPMGTFSLAT
ncbi:MAG: hypothetical protein ACRDIV_00700 [Ktedonobacteraceae bacterium]